MRCALVNQSTSIVDSIIIADPNIDPAPSGYWLIGLPNDSPVGIGWIYDPANGTFTDPNPPPPPDPIP